MGEKLGKKLGEKFEYIIERGSGGVNMEINNGWMKSWGKFIPANWTNARPDTLHPFKLSS